MQVLHIAAECYPAAKVGGLGDVVGALPKYLCAAGTSAAVIIPKYALKWFDDKHFSTVYEGNVRLQNQYQPFDIQKYNGADLGFEFFVANIKNKFARNGIYNDLETGYGYGDEVSRWLCFQQAVLKWIGAFSPEHQPKILHCHDHHTGLIPFFIKYCPEYRQLSQLKTVFTIHNGLYTGAYSWRSSNLLPLYQAQAQGLLDWNDTINPLASAIRCADVVTTVSGSYLNELMQSANGLEWLYRNEAHKSIGIVNGIDAEVWDPKTDSALVATLKTSIPAFKLANKTEIINQFDLQPDLPMVTFVGRLVAEKGADLIPDIISRVLNSGLKVNFVILGSGDPQIAEHIQGLTHYFPQNVGVRIAYNEKLAHVLYAASDFLLMPSLIEPCGLNQLYAMRYGSVPIVRSVGGLRDTVPDIGEPDGSGRGIRFDRFSGEDGFWAIYRAVELYKDKKAMLELQKKLVAIDSSWEKTVKIYQDIYGL